MPATTGASVPGCGSVSPALRPSALPLVSARHAGQTPAPPPTRGIQAPLGVVLLGISGLLNDPAVSGLAVNVETFKGTVQVSGFVKTAAERARLKWLAPFPASSR